MTWPWGKTEPPRSVIDRVGPDEPRIKIRADVLRHTAHVDRKNITVWLAFSGEEIPVVVPRAYAHRMQVGDSLSFVLDVGE